jgi:LPXTG-site transpeptidase (sortase) family protein
MITNRIKKGILLTLLLIGSGGMVFIGLNAEAFKARTDYRIQNLAGVTRNKEEYKEHFQNSYLVIPSIRVRAPIIWGADLVTSQQRVASFLAHGVAHDNQSDLPDVLGESGNVVITGHSSDVSTTPSPYKAVFANLDRLVPGDRVEITFSAQKFVYIAKESHVIAATDVHVIDHTKSPNVTLITCWPVGTRWKRWMIRAELERVYDSMGTVISSTSEPESR